MPLNLLLIVADDHGWDKSFLNRDPLASIPPMPRLEQLADQGVSFTEFRSEQLCSQTRAALLTGRHGYRHGVIFTGNASYQFQASEYTYADDLEGKGYETALIGKWALETGSDDNDAPRTIGGFGHFSGMYPVDATTPIPAYKGWWKTTNGAAQAETSDVYLTTDEADDAIAWISTATEPWSCQVSFHAAHAIGGLNNYPFPPADLHGGSGTEGENGGESGADAMLEALDKEMARLLATVDFSDTLVIYMGDNGGAYPQPPYSSTQKKGTQYDNAVRTPLVFAGAGVVAPGRESGVLCSPVDLYPTVMRHLGNWSVSSPNVIDGRDISGVLRNELVATTILYHEGGTTWRSVNDGVFRLVDYYSEASQDLFFDLENDPAETTNLGTSGLDARAQRHYNNLRYNLETRTAKTLEPEVPVNYAQPSVVTGGINVVRGGTSVSKPSVGAATITCDEASGATDYTLWKRSGDFGSWQDTGIEEVVSGGTVTFTDPSPVGRPTYRITNDAPEP